MEQEFDLQNSLVSRIVGVAGRIEQYANRTMFEPMGLSFSSARILLLVARGLCAPMDIQNELHVTKSNVSQRLSFLKKKGMLTRATDSVGDRRFRKVTLTDFGLQKVKEIHDAIASCSLEIEKTMNANDVEACECVLTNIQGLLDVLLNEKNENI